MQIYIDKRSEVPVRDQLRQQIIFLIGTGQLSIGMELPSVGQLARQLKVHHNTISHAYSQLTRDGWLIKKPAAASLLGRPQRRRLKISATLMI
jgi:DNA-binding transcriptional regulator YhcF (GntR family)